MAIRPPKALGSGQPLTFSLDVRKVGAWEKARELVGPRSAVRIARASRMAMRQEAQFARKMIVQGIREQAPGGRKFKPLSPSTLAIREFRGFRGSKALIERGDLRNSVKVTETPEGAFIGILRTARSRDGDQLANIAETQEEGRTIVMRATPKMLALLHMAGRKTGHRTGSAAGSLFVGGVIIIKIPARPFVKPVFDKWFADKSKVQFRVLLKMARILKADYGFPGGVS